MRKPTNQERRRVRFINGGWTYVPADYPTWQDEHTPACLDRDYENHALTCG